MPSFRILVSLLALGTTNPAIAQSSLPLETIPLVDLTVLGEPLESHQTSLREWMLAECDRALDRRLEVLKGLRTKHQIAQYQSHLRDVFLDALGGFPEKSLLNARQVATLAGDGYHVEKVIFESQPQFFVTGALYLPDSPPPYPGVLFPCGHSEVGKAEPLYQLACISLARNGIAVFCYDPIGQGERKQILEETSPQEWKAPFRATREHMLCGVAPILLGRSLATFRIWDGIRALDYLASRPDIDATKLGCTGNSGGGLMTSYLMALDPRIVAAAPSCFITTSRLKNRSPGPGDAEQNLFGQFKHGLDHPDFVIMHTPKPTLICAATKDFVPIAGTREAFRQSRGIAERLDAGDRVALVEADEAHSFSRPLREAMVRCMRRWLLGQNEPVDEEPAEVRSAAELSCTPDGQVRLLDQAKSIFDLNLELAGKIADERQRSQVGKPPAKLRAEIRQLAGIRPLDQIPRPQVVRRGTIKRAGYAMERICLLCDDGFVLPSALFTPDNRQGADLLYLNQLGKAANVDAIVRMVGAGHRVLAVDLRGFGETAANTGRYGEMEHYLGSNVAEFFMAYMLGRTFVGMRAEDTLVSLRFLAEAPDAAASLQIVAIGAAGVPVLHAAALLPEQIAGLRMVNALDSWQRVVESSITVNQLESTVHGALRTYDLTDLVRLCGSNRVAFESE